MDALEQSTESVRAYLADPKNLKLAVEIAASGDQQRSAYLDRRLRARQLRFALLPALVTLTDTDIQVRFQKRAHNPLLLAAGLEAHATPVPWLGGKTLRFTFGE
jgi:hypothetical protein